MLVKVDLEFHFGAIVDLIREAIIAVAITITLENTHSIVTLFVGYGIFFV